MSNRRTYINLAESLRTADVTDAVRKSAATAAAISLSVEPDFNTERFLAHALSDSDSKPEWDGSAQEWTYVNDEGNTVVLKRGNGVEVRVA